MSNLNEIFSSVEVSEEVDVSILKQIYKWNGGNFTNI